MAKLSKALIVVILATVFNGSASAQGEPSKVHPFLDREYFLDLGVYFPERKLSASVDGTIVGVNADIDFEGGSQARRDDNIFALEFGWHFGEKWSFRAQYFGNSPSRTAALEEDVEWKDIVFGAGSNVTLGSDFQLTRMFFGRKFETSEQHDFGIGGGLHWLKIGAYIEGEAIINGVPSGVRREAVSATAPLPNIGAWYTYSLSPRWAAHTRFDWFAAGIGDYDGSLVNAAVGINYKLTDFGGIGLSYSVFDLDLDISKTNWNGSISTRYSGIFASASFYW